MLAKYVARRFLASIIVVLGVTAITLALMKTTSGSYVPGIDLTTDPPNTADFMLFQQTQGAGQLLQRFRLDEQAVLLVPHQARDAGDASVARRPDRPAARESEASRQEESSSS